LTKQPSGSLGQADFKMHYNQILISPYLFSM